MAILPVPIVVCTVDERGDTNRLLFVKSTEYYAGKFHQKGSIPNRVTRSNRIERDTEVRSTSTGTRVAKLTLRLNLLPPRLRSTGTRTRVRVRVCG
jgi:hypothetical protein